MTQAEFMNRIRSLYNIDGWQLPELNDGDWPKFRDDPARYLVLCSDRQADAIWREVEKRQAKGS